MRAQALLHQCHAAEYIVNPGQMLGSMLNQVSVIVDSANTVFTFIRCQLPYPYVHLVSFTVHFYLFFWATYTGFMLYAGVPDGALTESGEIDLSSVGTSGQVTARQAAVRSTSVWRLFNFE